MYYNRLLRCWVFDPMDYFLLSIMVGSLSASYLKKHLSEEKSMERLRNSIIEKSNIKKSKGIVKSHLFGSKKMSIKKMSIKKIFKFALENRGGEFEDLIADHKFTNEALQLAQRIQEVVERLARFLKKHELEGVARIFFKGGTMFLQLFLRFYKIDLKYLVFGEGVNVQIIVITMTVGGVTGFLLSWFSLGTTFLAPPVLASFYMMRSLSQQISHNREYPKLKNFVNELLQDEEIKSTIRAVVVDEEIIIPSTSIEMKPWDSGKNSMPEFNFESDQTLEEFTKSKLKEELGLVENPTHKQIQEIVQRAKRKTRRKGKTVYFKDFIEKIAEDPDNIRDAEIINKPIRNRIRNKEL